MFSSDNQHHTPITETKKGLFHRLKSRFQKSPQSQSSATSIHQDKSTQLADRLKQNWHFLAMILIVMVIALLVSSIDWSNNLVNMPKTQIAQKPIKQLDISFATTMLILINFVGLLESWSRNERLWMDWWIAPLIIGLLIFKDRIPHDPWLISISFFTAAFLFAIIQNESQQNQPLWAQIDTTPLASLTGQLLLIRYVEAIPYPEYIPVWILWALFIPALFKELLRTPFLAIFTALLGITMAFTLSAVVIMVCSILAIVVVTLGASQDWLPTYGKHKTDLPFKIGGRQFALVIPWDNILGMLYIFAFLSLQIYQGNWALLHFFL